MAIQRYIVMRYNCKIFSVILRVPSGSWSEVLLLRGARGYHSLEHV